MRTAMELSDQELVRRMASGDESALGALFDRHAGRVYGLLLRIVRRYEVADDLLQVTFCESWRRSGGFDPLRSRVDSWLLLIARSRALDHLRSRKPSADAVDGREPSTTLDPAVELERAEAAQGLREALLRLPPDQRRVIELAFFGGLTHEQIAKQLSVPLGTVKTRIRLGMTRLRDLLREN